MTFMKTGCSGFAGTGKSWRQDLMISGGLNTEEGGLELMMIITVTGCLELMIITVTGCLELMIFQGGMERIIQTKWVTG